MLDDNDEDYDSYSINNKKYQSFCGKNLLPFCDSLEKIKPNLIKLMRDCCKVRLNVNVVFRQERLKKSKDKIIVYIKSKNTTDIDEIFNQLIEKHEELSESFKHLNFIPEGIDSIIYKLTVTNTFINPTEWIINKNCVINPQNKDNKCFQYSIVSLYHKQIGRNPFRISKIKPLIYNLNWENINFTPQEQDYKTFEINNKSIALNVLIVPNNEDIRKISQVYKSEFNKTRENRVILLMITDSQKQHFLAVKRLNALLKKKAEHSGDYCLDCFKLFRNKTSFRNHKC